MADTVQGNKGPDVVWPCYRGAPTTTVVDALLVKRVFLCGYPRTKEQEHWLFRGRPEDLRQAGVWRNKFALPGRQRVKYGSEDEGSGYWSVRLRKHSQVEIGFTNPPEDFRCAAFALLRKGQPATLSDEKVKCLIESLQGSDVAALVVADGRMARTQSFRSDAGASIRDYIFDMIMFRASTDFGELAWSAAGAVLAAARRRP